MSDREPLDTWAIVEVLGRQTFAGKVTEQGFGGASLLRVDVPALEEKREEYEGYGYDDAGKYKTVKKERIYPATQELTTFIGIGSIYKLTPCTKEAAISAAEKLRHAPAALFDIPQSKLALAAAVGENDDEDEDDDGRF